MRLKYITLCLLGLSISGCTQHVIKSNASSDQQLGQQATQGLNAMFENASYWIYPIMMKEKIRVWVYSGDVDADVPITGTLTWIERLREEQGLPIIDPWR